MAQNLTQAAQLAAQAQEKRPEIALEIDGFDLVFSTSLLQKVARYGEDDIFFGKPGLVYGGFTENTKSRDYISISGSSTSITQQLKQDKGSVSSVTNLKVKLIDFGLELTELFAPGAVVSDLLARKARLSFLFAGTSYPEDSIELIDGIVSNISADAASFTLQISHPEQLKRQELFAQDTKNLENSINDTVTTLTLDDTSDMLLPTADFQTYVRINDELLEYTAISGNDLTVTRGQLNTVASGHEADDEVDQFWRIKGNAIDISLKIMLSAPEKPFYFDSIYESSPDGVTLRFSEPRLKTQIGVVVGDEFEVYDNTGVLESGSIVEIQESDIETLVVTNGTEVPLSGGNVRFKSKYNVWPVGLSMLPDQVDIEEHERILGLFSPRFPEMDLYIKESVQGKDLISEDLMFPNGLYVIPRRGRVSLGITVPPLGDLAEKTLDDTNILNPDKINITRSVNKNFYNSVAYKYNEDSIEDKLLSGLATLSQQSVNLIDFRNKTLKVEARGFRPNARTQIRNQANAFLRRYQFAADFVAGVEVMLGTGFNIDVGDRVLFGNSQLKIYDSKQGNRDFTPRIMEVVNKRFDLRGRITLDLLDTLFTTRARYGLIAPASIIDSAAGNEIKLKRSFTTIEGASENAKYERYIEGFVRVYTEDYSVIEELQLLGISTSDPNTVIVETPSVTVTEGMKFTIANYSKAGNTAKSRNCFFNPSERVATGTSDTVFNLVNASTLFVGSIVSVNKPDYTVVSPEVIVSNIDGTEITVDNSLGFTPVNGDEVNLIGFKSDKGLPYRIL